jgi:hypothetical protein
MAKRKPKRTAKTTKTAKSAKVAKKTRRRVAKKAGPIGTAKRVRRGAKKPAQRAPSRRAGAKKPSQRAPARHGYNPQTGSPTGAAVGDAERLEQLTAEFMAQGMSAHEARDRARAIMHSSLD